MPVYSVTIPSSSFYVIDVDASTPDDAIDLALAIVYRDATKADYIDDQTFTDNRDEMYAHENTRPSGNIIYTRNTLNNLPDPDESYSDIPF